MCTSGPCVILDRGVGSLKSPRGQLQCLSKMTTVPTVAPYQNVPDVNGRTLANPLEANGRNLSKSSQANGRTLTKSSLDLWLDLS